MVYQDLITAKTNEQTKRNTLSRNMYYFCQSTVQLNFQDFNFMRNNVKASLFHQIFTAKINKKERGLAAIILDSSAL